MRQLLPRGTEGNGGKALVKRVGANSSFHRSTWVPGLPVNMETGIVTCTHVECVIIERRSC